MERGKEQTPTQVTDQGKAGEGGMLKEKDRILKALDSIIFMDHLKAKNSPSAGLVLTPSSATSGERRLGRPWDRGDLYLRLQTFKPSTWFAKPAKVGAQECARRGWENSGEDELTCETCRAVVKFPVSMEDLDENIAEAALDRFAKLIVSAHNSTCPWKSSVCSISLLRFPSIPQATIASDFRDRVNALRQILCVPPIAEAAVDTILLSSSAYKAEVVLRKGHQFSSHKRAIGQDLPKISSDMTKKMMETLKSGVASCFERNEFMARIHLLALCGWGLSVLKGITEKTDDTAASVVLPDHATLICSLCGARVGLWSYFEGCKPKPLSGVLSGMASQPFQRQKGSFSLNHQVASNLTTTIAGGMLKSHLEGDTSGPFGKPSTVPLFSHQPYSGDFINSTSSSLGQKRPKDDSEDNQNSVKRQKMQRNKNSTSSAVAKYRGICKAAFDPLESHRSFCPWVHSYKSPGDQDDNSCGWKSYADNLVYDSLDVLKKSSEFEDEDTDGWNAKDLFQRMLKSVPIKK